MSEHDKTNRKGMGQFQFYNMNEKEEMVILIDPKSKYKGSVGTGKTYYPFNADNVTKMMANKEIKAIIHDFYKKEYKYFVSVGVDDLLSDESTADEGYRFIMFQLQEGLAYKCEYESLNESETILHFILSNDSSKKHKYVFSDQLVNAFKNVLKKVDK